MGWSIRWFRTWLWGCPSALKLRAGGSLSIGNSSGPARDRLVCLLLFLEDFSELMLRLRAGLR